MKMNSENFNKSLSISKKTNKTQPLLNYKVPEFKCAHLRSSILQTNQVDFKALQPKLSQGSSVSDCDPLVGENDCNYPASTAGVYL